MYINNRQLKPQDISDWTFWKVFATLKIFNLILDIRIRTNPSRYNPCAKRDNKWLLDRKKRIKFLKKFSYCGRKIFFQQKGGGWLNGSIYSIYPCMPLYVSTFRMRWTGSWRSSPPPSNSSRRRTTGRPGSDINRLLSNSWKGIHRESWWLNQGNLSVYS